MSLKAPFPYFGGKSTVSSKVWSAIGQPKHYIEPFFGSGAVLLNRPNHDPTNHVETVNDKDGFICNVWRALQYAPDDVAKFCDWPVNHADMSSRKLTLLASEANLLQNLITDDNFFDSKIAGYWIWLACVWIGGGMTTQTKNETVRRPHLTNAGVGVHTIGKIPHIGNAGRGVQEPYNTNIYAWFRELSERLRYVRVVCGDWKQVCGGKWQDNLGNVGIFFDPPYSDTDRGSLYHHEDFNVAKEVAEWCVERGKIPTYRIVVCGYDSEHSILDEAGWKRERWKTTGGYGNITQDAENLSRGQDNRKREIIWYSPHCYKNTLFDREEA
jgi:DNA adenine methylase